MKLYCKNCQYSFDAENMPLACPLCGEENKVQKQQSAEELVKNLGNNL